MPSQQGGATEAPMTPEQAERLQELARRAGDPDAFELTLTRQLAAERIAALEARLDKEQHSGKERLPRT